MCYGKRNRRACPHYVEGRTYPRPKRQSNPTRTSAMPPCPTPIVPPAGQQQRRGEMLLGAPFHVPTAIMQAPTEGDTAVQGKPLNSAQALGSYHLESPVLSRLMSVLSTKSCIICRVEGRDQLEAKLCPGKARRSYCPNRVEGKTYPKS